MHRLYGYEHAAPMALPEDAPAARNQFIYDRSTLWADLNAGIVVTIVLVPSAMAYAMLAGLPPQVGLYACVLPLLAYAAVGKSRIVSVGPVTIVSLMTASTLAPLTAGDPSRAVGLAATLALLCAASLWLASVLRLGRFVSLINHTVLAGFLTAVGIIIACSQLKHFVGVALPKSDVALVQIWHALRAPAWNPAAIAIGAAALAALVWKADLAKRLAARGWLSPSAVAPVQRAMPLIVALGSVGLVMALGLQDRVGLAVIGALPRVLPEFSRPALSIEHWHVLVPGAILMSLIGFVECASVVKGLEPKSGERLDLDRELAAMAAANLGASVTGGYPVSGGTVRSVVNFNAGARTAWANAWAALAVLAVLVVAGSLIERLPMAVLAAIVMAASLSIIDVSILRGEAELVDKAIFALTLAVTMFVSPETGLVAGIAASRLLPFLADLPSGSAGGMLARAFVEPRQEPPNRPS